MKTKDNLRLVAFLAFGLAIGNAISNFMQSVWINDLKLAVEQQQQVTESLLHSDDPWEVNDGQNWHSDQ